MMTKYTEGVREPLETNGAPDAIRTNDIYKAIYRKTMRCVIKEDDYDNRAHAQRIARDIANIRCAALGIL